MKTLLPIIMTLTIVCFGYSQKEDLSSSRKIYDNDLRRANNYFQRAFYAKAIPLYEKVSRKHRTNEVVENLATCYYNVGNLKASARFYGYLVNRNSKNKTYTNVFKYVQALKASGNYADANSVMREYLVEIADSIAVAKFDKEVKKQENIIAIGQRYNLENLNINTDKSEFGMVPYKDHLVFAASKKEDKDNNLLQGYYGWNAEPFLDIYTIHKDSLSSNILAIQSISKEVNTKLHEGTVTFSKDGNTMYFTRNNYYKHKEVKDDKLVTHLKLYKAERVEGVWTNVEPLPFNGDSFSVEHPALSPDGKRLYFSSDMTGSFGSFDLFYVDINPNGTYGAPINLGTKINTKHREQFPYIAANGDLYFSSNGHFGFGGLDVFWSKLEGAEFQEPDNLGLPLNSGYDDFAFFLDTTLKSGYISSNRSQGKGADDIYSFNEVKPLIIEDCKQFIAGIITDKESQSPLFNAKVTITQIPEDIAVSKGVQSTQADGTFKDTTICGITLLVKATAEGYQEAERKLVITNERGITNDASLALISLASIKKKEEEAQQKQLKEQQKRDQEKKIQEEEKRKADALRRKQSDEDIIASEPYIKRKDGRLIIETEEIHFDYKLWYVRRDVKKVLQRVVDLMKKYPKMQIEVESHTDMRGNKVYNRDLSQKRATSTKEYLQSQDIEAYRVSAIGYGESRPLQECATEAACSEEEHEVNRRSEIVIRRLQ